MSFLTPTSFPSLFRSSYFGSSGSVPEMDFSRPTLRVMARGLRPCLPRRPPSNLRLRLSFQLDPGFKPRMHHHCNPSPVSVSPHWTDAVSRRETSARRDKFRNVGWRPPNHKSKTKTVITYAKMSRRGTRLGAGPSFTFVLSRCERLTV